jgi:cysteine-rich repeat protein
VLLFGVSVFILINATGSWAADNPPADRCLGYGRLQSIALADWESGLGAWTASTHDVANTGTFDTPDWASVGNLPDARQGRAGFVANLDIGDCGADDQAGALALDSPSITIPGDTDVPRISFHHWFETELEYDGGNIKISVNGGAFNIVPASAFEFGEHNGTLAPAFDDIGLEDNTNPLAGEEAFTGTLDGNPSGIWTEARINLLGIAAPGDTIKLRFDFGIDGCDGAVGWYVDDVEVYGCAAELPPSDCGNGKLDQGEQCDDGNDFINDGCSNTCQVESGWECTDPGTPGSISDPGFEAGTPNPYWVEISNNPIGTPICEVAVCGKAGGTGPSEGRFWVNLGSIKTYQEGSVSQSIVIPSSVSTLTFDLEIPSCDSAADYMELLIDNQTQLRIDGSSPRCGTVGYTTQTVDISAYADGGTHDIEFHSETFSNNGGVSSFFVDAIAMPGNPSMCTRTTSGTRLTLTNQVTNDNGGTARASDWLLTASGPSPFSGQGPEVSGGSALEPGSYNLSASGPEHYQASDWVCAGTTQVDGDTVQLAAGEDATCSLTLDDVPPSLSLVKRVVNDDGGVATPADWTLRADGPSSFSGRGPQVFNGANFQAGTYDLSESGGPGGYVASDWICEGGSQQDADTVLLNPGDSAVCTITNDDTGIGFAINQGLAGGWFDEDTSGQGILLDIRPEDRFMFMAWFTYTDADSAHPNEHRWLTAQGNYSGDTAVLELYEILGGRFDNPQDVSVEPIGEVSLRFSSCDLAEMEFVIGGEGLQGTISLQRLIPGSGALCEQLSGASTQAVDINDGMDGGWYEPDTAGQGFLIDTRTDAQDGNFVFVAWFTYGDDTASGLRWLTAQGGFEGSLAEIEISETTGGSFNDPLTPTTLPVGTMRIDFTDCSTATLTYDLPDDGATGEIPLVRLLPGSEALCEELSLQD